ncbi:restriction endonuclease subunit S [Flaviflexus massiliensis]|uniref:restriction endonuclease subunit S n=1 Tax=Flaviflexus massiliensis TaxID=1522309 RepID=UPI0006D5431F|nr:restriction endonuclease subunit S [Flaviflexus massiliensis]
MKEIDTSGWGEFRVDDLFTLVKGSRLTSLARSEGDIPYVGASQFNNGITHYIGNDDKLHPAGVLTVCYNGPVGTTFYQPQKFWATDDVNVLYPKSPMSMESMLFIAPMIENAGSEYAYIDKWKMTDMAAAVIRLPVTPDGCPDWDCMEQTMRGVIAEREAALDSLQALAGA